MKKEKYVAYVSTYTHGDDHGIKIYDVDLEVGRLKEKGSVEITNPSHVTISHNGKYLYSITDFGVEAYNILEDGMLELINFAPINGMRGCYISTDYKDEFLFVAGYHDGKLTILKLDEDGSIIAITDEIFHKGLGIVAERNFRPHINCAKMTHDNKYLLVCDQGMDHVIVYRLDHFTGKVTNVDVIRCELESAPRHIRFSEDGRFLYVVHEWKCFIDVYSYEEKNDMPYFEKIQTISTCDSKNGNAASALGFSEDYKYLLTSNAGDNSVAVYAVDKETGLLTRELCLPVAGEYPKDAIILPGDKHLVSLNHESNEMTFFKLDHEKGTLIMNGPAVHVDAPNCIVLHKLK